jgi:hypothetical protein
MTIVRIGLSMVAAIFSALLIVASRFLGNSKATGIAGIPWLFFDSLMTPLFWILAVSLCALFLLASRVQSKPLRVLLFWTPVTAISTLEVGVFALIAYAWIHFKQR